MDFSLGIDRMLRIRFVYFLEVQIGLFFVSGFLLSSFGKPEIQRIKDQFEIDFQKIQTYEKPPLTIKNPKDKSSLFLSFRFVLVFCC